jgi:hypothetical protein
MSRVQKVIESAKGISFRDPDLTYMLSYYNITENNCRFLLSERWFITTDSFYMNIDGKYYLQTSFVDFRHTSGYTAAGIGLSVYFASFLLNNFQDLLLCLANNVEERTKNSQR